jgi:hypothetical protein
MTIGEHMFAYEEDGCRGVQLRATAIKHSRQDADLFLEISSPGAGANPS